MRYLLILWFTPLLLFWGWFALSAYDLNFGSVFLSRDLHDIVMAVYARSIGVDPEAIPRMFASASIIDSALVGAIVAYRWRERWLPALRDCVESRVAGHLREAGEPAAPTNASFDPMRPEG